MAFLVNCIQAVLLTILLSQLTAGLPVLDRNDEDLADMISELSLSNKYLFGKGIVGGTHDSKMNQPRRSSLQTRQLGDIEFSNRYAEYLRSKAKVTSICAFLRRMQNAKKSGLGGDTERVNLLLKEYMCPDVYQ